VIVLSFETQKKQEEILDKAVRYFTEEVGLEVTERSDCCVHFQDRNQLGHIKVTLSQRDAKFEVDVESREYDYQAKQFVSKFK
jgi:hypothetical protein